MDVNVVVECPNGEEVVTIARLDTAANTDVVSPKLELYCAEEEQGAVVNQGRRIRRGLRSELSSADRFPISSDRRQFATARASN